MATTTYEVKYTDGRTRTKLLTVEGAKETAELSGVEGVKRIGSVAANKSRAAAEDK